MQDHDIYAKTGAGRDEIATRRRQLKPALRALLLIVDGQRDVRALRRLGGGLQASEDGLAQLHHMELIALRDAPGQPAAVPGRAGVVRRLLSRR